MIESVLFTIATIYIGSVLALLYLGLNLFFVTAQRACTKPPVASATPRDPRAARPNSGASQA